MRCPSCSDQVLEPKMRAGIEIDVCPSCRGIWLDRGELDNLLQSARQAHLLAPVTATDYESTAPDSEPSVKVADADGSDRDINEPEGEPKGDKKARKRKKSWPELLGDAMEEIIEEIEDAIDDIID